MIQNLETKTVYNNQAKTAEYAIIWLHGLGADYNDFLPVVDELKLTKNVKFVFQFSFYRLYFYALFDIHEQIRMKYVQ